MLIDLRKLGTLAECLANDADEAARRADKAQADGALDAALIAVGEAKGLRAAANAVIEIAKRELA